MPSETTEALFQRYGPGYRWFATVTVMLGTISAVLTTTSVNVAIPDIMGAFGIGQDRAQWLSTGALAAMTVGMLLNAWMMRSFGQRRTFIGALCIFVASLALAGLSPNESVLIFCRIVQGAVAGILQPLSMYTLFKVFPPGQRGSAMGFFGMSVILGPALGPTLGGVMIDQFNWRYIFYVAAPVCAIAILMGSVFLPEREEAGARVRFDWLGFLLLVTALACLLTGLSNGQREGWYSDYILGLFAVAVLAAFSFIVWELRAPQPLVNFKVLANPQFTGAAIVACIFGAGLFGSTYLVPLFVQTVQHLTPLSAGLMLMPAGLVMGVFMPFAGYLADRVPARTLIISGLLCFAISSYWLAGVDANMSFWTIAWCVIISRLGLSLIKPTLNLAALRSLRPELLGQGAGMINFSRQLGGAFGVNLLSVTLDRRTFFHSESLTSLQTAGNSATTELLRVMEEILARAGAPPDLQSAGALDYLGRVVYAQAYTMGFRDSFLIVAIVFVLGLIPAWIMGRVKPAAAGS
ncbi:MAG: DHA2 family efflux MFS transporter permease subunit [Betaproteobacteria bacterium]|nr:DHA2 family efflux MFS transporter permease subunit [Betaproteobacteria bacterium]MDH3437071.1 DHA2 family efflux MFS transporter permease subunit [Betaproteobacteria bacterium]